MKRHSLAFLAAALLPAVGFADEKPLWEVVTRVDGRGEGSPIQDLVKELLSGADSAGVLGEEAVFRVAGFENAATEEEDWVAEIGGLADAGALLKQLGEAVEADSEGRYVIEEEGLHFVVWRDGESGLRLAGPPVNAGVTVIPVAKLGEGESVSGWVDLARLGQGEIESKSLKLPESLGFTAATTGDGIELELVAELASEDLVGATRKLLEEMQAELAKEPGEDRGRFPGFGISAEGKQLKVKVTVTAEELDRLIGEATKAVVER